MRSFSNHTFTGAYEPQNCISAEESVTELFHRATALCCLDRRIGMTLVLGMNRTSTGRLTFRPVRDHAPSVGALYRICASWF